MVLQSVGWSVWARAPPNCGKLGGRFAKLATMGAPDALVGTLSQKRVRAVLFD
jgi:hypothetical protein